MNAALRDLPAMHRLLAEPVIATFADLLGPTAVKTAVDAVLADAREQILAGEPPPTGEAIGAAVARMLARTAADGLVPLINATGILLHTNLGRAPLAAEALAAVHAAAGGYANLEFDVAAGARGSRYERLGALLRETTGAEDGIVVNNCAAAVLLALDTFAKGREVIVARNQLIEIGGGFRLPDVLARSGATLVEVGATNKVYVDDFARALTPRTALLLRGHASNFRIEGFVADVVPSDLARLGRRVGVPVLEDLGSGALVDFAAYGLPHERTVREAVADGIDLVAFSGDKLLGGPQAGIVVGRRAAIARLRANPLLRALRVDKGTLAALGATLRLYGEAGAIARIPLFAMLGVSLDALRERASHIAASVAHARCSAVETHGYVGGGALPLAPIPSAGVAVRGGDAGASPAAVARQLRDERPPVVARIERDAVVLDMRTIPPVHDAFVVDALRRALA